MSRLGAAVHVITTDGPAGRAGFTASAVCSVSDSPPTLLVCINRGSASHDAFVRNRVLCVNTLGAGQEDVSRRFSQRMSIEERFRGDTWIRLASGAPVLRPSVASFDCEIVNVVSAGTHDVLLCEVRAIDLRGIPDPALMYAARRYHNIPLV
nr:flavin reductase [Pandoraea cepalis]